MKLVILDRDGVINEESDEFVKTPSEWVPLPGSLEAVTRLKRAGWTVFLATNQSGLSRGLFDLAAFHEMHRKMRRLLGELGGDIDGIEYCPHAQKDDCECRKPKPGMYLSIARRLDVGLDDVPIIGDSPRDLEAARAVGARPILVLTGKGVNTLQAHPELAGGEVYENLAGAVDQLLSET